MAGKKINKRDDELCRKAKIKDKLLDIQKDVVKGFLDQNERSDQIMDAWDIYNCILGPKQFYNGTSKVFVPIVRNAIRARRTRFVNQLFPRSGRHVEAVSADPEPPHALLALVESYVGEMRLRTQTIPALLVNGDIEGQYTIYVDWATASRTVIEKAKNPVRIDGIEVPELGDDIETMTERTIPDDKPVVEVISDADFLVLPATVDRLEDAIDRGGSVTITRRWTKEQVKTLIKSGDIDKEAGEVLIDAMSIKEGPGNKDVPKQLAKDMGIKTREGSKFVQVYETWAKLTVDGEKRLCRCYFAGSEVILSCKLNPYWCDRLPVLSAPVEKLPGVFKGASMISAGIIDQQIAANDAINQALDSLSYGLSPLVAVDPEKVSRWQELIMDVAAVWPVGPDGVKLLQFPIVVREAYEVVASAKAEIFQALSVNPAMLPQQTGSKGGKRNQAEIANEQQVDLLTTADAVINIEQEILTPLVTRIIEYDAQFREQETLVRAYGDMGLKASMERIPTLQLDHRLTIRWFGVDAARNAAEVQQMIAGLNVLRGIPPQMYPGFKFQAAPLITHLVEQIYGPRLAPQIFQSQRDQVTVDPEIENQMLMDGMPVPVNGGDDDPKHIQAHMALPPGLERDAHIATHQQAMQMKAMQQQMQQAQQQGGQPGMPGGAGPGSPGTPRPGAQPAQPRQNFGPPGMIRPDAMPRAGAAVMPRRA